MKALSHICVGTSAVPRSNMEHSRVCTSIDLLVLAWVVVVPSWALVLLGLLFVPGESPDITPHCRMSPEGQGSFFSREWGL